MVNKQQQKKIQINQIFMKKYKYDYLFKFEVGNFINMKPGCINSVYEIKELLGKGAYGEVFKVKVKGTDNYRAMKIVDKSKMHLEDNVDLYNEL